MASVNKITLIGYLGKDPEIKTLGTGTKVASFSLATTERAYTTKSGQQVPERVDWHNIIAWGGIADVIERYAHKGDPLYVEGKVHYRSYDAKDGYTRHVTEIIAADIQLLPKGGGGQQRQWNANGQRQPQGQHTTGNARNGYGSDNQPAPVDDLPF